MPQQPNHSFPFARIIKNKNENLRLNSKHRGGKGMCMNGDNGQVFQEQNWPLVKAILVRPNQTVLTKVYPNRTLMQMCSYVQVKMFLRTRNNCNFKN